MGRAIDASRGDEHPRHWDRLALQVAGLDRGEVLERDLHAAALQRNTDRVAVSVRWVCSSASPASPMLGSPANTK